MKADAPESSSSAADRRGLSPIVWPARIAEGLVRLWRIFPGSLMPPLCRYRPTCSHYMLRALRLHGLWKGSFLGLTRLCRCHPFSKGGFDPVPGDEEAGRADYEASLLRQFED